MDEKKQRQIEELKAAMQDHQRKLETDPEYRKRYEETSARMDKVFGRMARYGHENE